jgi:membrane-bound lytic murein transglycosylase C
MKLLFFIIALSSLLLSENYRDFKESDESEFIQFAEGERVDFSKFKRELESDFNSYKKVLDKEYAQYKRELEKLWSNPETSSNHVWVEYSKDKRSRTKVDFEANEITIEVISNQSMLSVTKSLFKKAVLTIAESPKDAYQKDELTQRVEDSFSKVAKTPLLKEAVVEKEPILEEAIFEKKVSIREKVKFIKANATPIEEKPSKVSGQKVYSMKVSLPKNFPINKAKQFSGDIKRYSKRFRVDSALIYAIMHSESSFNPMAKSHIPAYGLMQIVPRSAGIDAYQMVYNKKRVLPASYLYNSRNNIELGSAYLHILNYKYLKSIKDQESRLYCVISAYNTGAGNVAKTFTGKTSIRQASEVINRMEPQEVYNKLIRDLPYDETRRYLKKVHTRYEIYKKANM